MTSSIERERLNVEDGENINHSFTLSGKMDEIGIQSTVKTSKQSPKRQGFLEDWPVKSKKTEEGRKERREK